ncbi:MAG: SMC-Scp complex subunit ScpB [Planctomycetaceae bacterium]|nr:SMC-Scp complex subunit ScpB [Planctomycetaceae bacterium]
MFDGISQGFRRSTPTLQPYELRPPSGSEIRRSWQRGKGTSALASNVLESGDWNRAPKMARVEAALFVAGGALSPRRLAQVATLADSREAHAIIEQLNIAYDASKSAFRIERVAAGYQLLTRPELVSWLDRLHHRKTHMKLSSSMMETLSIIAFRQPCTRADVEIIRGVQSTEMIKQLMDRQLVKVVGEDDSLGRPFLYGTTRQFLEHFGLRSLDDLPMADSLRRPATRDQKSPDQDDPSEMTADAEEISADDCPDESAA